MTGERALERRYRRLLAWYPAAYRRAYGEEMIGVLMAAASDGNKRPGLAGALDLIGGGLLARLQAGRRTLAGSDWPDALAICSVAVPVILLGYFVSQWLFFLHVFVGAPHAQAGNALIVAAIAAPPLLALRLRRTAVVVAFGLAAWMSVYAFGGISPDWGGYWIVYGLPVSASLALILGAAGLSLSGGPRRAAEILTPRSWLVLIGAGILMGVIHPYLWSRPTWLVAVIVIGVLALVAASLALTIPGPAARGLLLLAAAPAYPGAVWAIGVSGSYGSDTSGFPSLVFLPTVLFAGLAATALWQWRRGTATESMPQP
jgi:hypothetical protein